MIDVNVSLSRWPFRRLPCDDLKALVQRLHARGITEAWAASFDGVWHKDLGASNARLVEQCRQATGVRLRPFGTVNPVQPDWREELRRCHEVHQMPGIRLYPSYHGYALDNPLFAELLSLAERSGMIVQLVVRMEDPRMQHPLARVEDVDTEPLVSFLAEHPDLPLVLLNALRSVRAAAVERLVAAGRVYVDIAMLEGVAGVEQLVQQVPQDRLLFGSHFPLFVLESALLKLRESRLGEAALRAITVDNASRLLSR